MNFTFPGLGQSTPLFGGDNVETQPMDSQAAAIAAVAANTPEVSKTSKICPDIILPSDSPATKRAKFQTQRQVVEILDDTQLFPNENTGEKDETPEVPNTTLAEQVEVKPSEIETPQPGPTAPPADPESAPSKVLRTVIQFFSTWFYRIWIPW